MAQTVGDYKCLFCTILLQILIIWDATAVIYHHQNRRSLAEDSRPVEPVETITEDYSYQDFEATPSPNDTVVNDHHVYYNSSFYSKPDVARSYWIDFKNIEKEKIITHALLSDSHRRAAGVTLSFEFPFYGHLMRNITIATGGFLYMGDHIHSWIAATQYIAPLMANFDPSLSESSKIHYIDNGTAFTVEWDHVQLKDRYKDGSFTFQTTLLKNGDIIFVYKEIPIPVLDISNVSHPVKVGCSDAYVMERSHIVLHRKIIYEYHRVDLKNLEISNNTILYLTALPTCLNYKDCESCISADIGFNCTWCESHGKCSDGLNRYRQEWLQLKCSEVNNSCPNTVTTASPLATSNASVVINQTTTISNATDNPLVGPTSTLIPSVTTNQSVVITDSISTTKSNIPDDKVTTDNPISGSRKEAYPRREESGIGAGGIFAIVLVITLALGIGMWAFYAYKNPQSSSGQLLIKYRPSQWHWKTEESRYSASVHM